jgi:hypothetical protein
VGVLLVQVEYLFEKEKAPVSLRQAPGFISLHVTGVVPILEPRLTPASSVRFGDRDTGGAISDEPRSS